MVILVCGQVSVASGGLRQLDASYNSAWLDVEEQDIGQLEWFHPQLGGSVGSRKAPLAAILH